jgi:hypothetical protein
MRTLLFLLLVGAVLALTADRAQAQGWFNRPYMGWRGANGWQQFPGQLGGGQIVGSVPFGGWVPQTTYTAAQWQQLVELNALQTPRFSAAEWNQLAALQAQLPFPITLSPRQQRQVTAMQIAAEQQQQQEALSAALQQLQQLQQKQFQPRRAPADGK